MGLTPLRLSLRPALNEAMSVSKVQRWILFAIDAVAALSTIAGGVELVSGLKRFPTSWLEGTPFSDYLAPGLILGIMVGGSAAIATVMTARSESAGAVASLIAGIILMGWIAGEVLLLNQPNPTWAEGIYFGVAAVMAILAIRVAPGTWHGLVRRAHLG